LKYLYLHGFLSGPASTKGEFLASKFSETGRELLRPDLNAGDFRNLTISNQLAIVRNAIQSSADKVTLIGSSLGGLIAVLAAYYNPQVDKIILMAPALDFVTRYFLSFTPEQLKTWKQRGYITLYHYQYESQRELGYNIVEDARKYQNGLPIRSLGTLIFHGIHDESVPYQVSIDYLQKNLGARLIIFNSDHGLIDQLDTMWKYLADFLKLD
jgi:pimeloyl-ACP methyl ester carboxylesterase